MSFKSSLAISNEMLDGFSQNKNFLKFKNNISDISAKQSLTTPTNFMLNLLLVLVKCYMLKRFSLENLQIFLAEHLDIYFNETSIQIFEEFFTTLDKASIDLIDDIFGTQKNLKQQENENKNIDSETLNQLKLYLQDFSARTDFEYEDLFCIVVETLKATEKSYLDEPVIFCEIQ